MVTRGLVDYHVHTRRCGHASGEVREYVQAAVNRGLKEIGIADHIPLYWLPFERRAPELAMPEVDLEAYVNEVLGVRLEFPEITVRLGIEADYVPGCEEQLREILSRFPFDYVLGSVHYIDGWGFDNPEFLDGYARHNIDTLYQKYFGLVQSAARSKLFDVITHPDLIKKFGHRTTGDLSGLYHGTACICAGVDVTVEVNTAGLRVPAREIYPAKPFLQYCHELNVPVSLGSDAHRPDQVAADFDQALALLRDIGYDEIAVFEGRKRSLLPLP